MLADMWLFKRKEARGKRRRSETRPSAGAGAQPGAGGHAAARLCPQLCPWLCPRPCPQPQDRLWAAGCGQSHPCSTEPAPGAVCRQSSVPGRAAAAHPAQGCSPAPCATQTQHINPNWARPLPLSSKRSPCAGSPCSGYLPTATCG